MVLAGEVIPNEETIYMARLVSDNHLIMLNVRRALDRGATIREVGEYLRDRVSKGIASWLESCDCPFVVFVINKSVRSAVDWPTVARMIAVPPESN